MNPPILQDLANLEKKLNLSLIGCSGKAKEVLKKAIENEFSRLKMHILAGLSIKLNKQSSKTTNIYKIN